MGLYGLLDEETCFMAVRHAWGCSLRQEWRELREDFLEQVWEACFQALLNR